MKIEELDSYEFYRDTWLKECVEVKSEGENDNKLDVKSEGDNLVGQESLRDANHAEHNDDLNEEDACVTLKSPIKKGMKKNVKECGAKIANIRISSPALKNATVSASASPGLCPFKCPDCDSTYTNWTKFMKHTHKQHEKKVSMSEAGLYLTQATVHICRICSIKIICETSFLTIHVRKHHLSLGEYRQKYNCSPIPEPHQELPAIVKNAPVSETAATRLCTFKCTECPVTYNGWLSYSAHLKTHFEGQHKPKPAMSDYKRYLVKAVIHICRICSAQVICDYSFLETHLKTNHKITLVQYKEKYNCHGGWTFDNQKLLENGRLSKNEIGNLCKFWCPNCKLSIKSLTTLWSHKNNSGEKCKGSARSCKSEYLKKVITHKCLICSKLLLCDARAIRKHISGSHNMTSLKEYAKKTKCTIIGGSTNGDKIKEVKIDVNKVPVSKKVGNLCKFKCNHCQCLTLRWPKMRNHLKNAHSSDFIKHWSKYICKIVMHKCMICQEKILNDKSFLYRHLQIKHCKGLSLYVKDHKLTNVKHYDDVSFD